MSEQIEVLRKIAEKLGVHSTEAIQSIRLLEHTYRLMLTLHAALHGGLALGTNEKYMVMPTIRPWPLWVELRPTCEDLMQSTMCKKGSEYYRLCSAKSTLGLSKVSDTAKLCVVLHIASEELSSSLDKAQAIKLSCLTKPAYFKLVHTYKSLLNGGASVTVTSLCSNLQISELTQCAQELLDKYEISQSKGPVDATQPMYACAAVLAASKLKRATIDKNHLKENCRVRWATVQKLSAEMVDLGKLSGEGRRKRKIGMDPSAIAAAIEKKSSLLADNSEETTDDKTELDPEDEYESWKRRILEQANP